MLADRLRMQQVCGQVLLVVIGEDCDYHCIGPQAFLNLETKDIDSNEAEERDTPMVRIRVAPAFFNNTAEVKRFLKVAEQLMKA